MDEARQVIERLERIDALKGRGAPARELLAEVRLLLAEGERWLAAERVAEQAAKAGIADPDQAPIERAAAALSRCRDVVDRSRAVADVGHLDRAVAGAEERAAIGREVIAGTAV